MIKAEIKDKELLQHLETLEQDKMHVFVMADGRIRGALFHGTRFVNQIRAQHNLGILETMIFGQGCLCGALTIPMMKDMENLSIKYEVSGPAQGFAIDADSKGYIRGYLFNESIPVTKPLENWNLKEFLGEGTLTFSRIHKDDKYPQSSTVSVDSGNIANDFAWYFQQSEQTQTAFHSSIQMDKKGRVIGAGGLFLQVMPSTGGTKKVGSQLNSSSNWDDDEVLLQKVENAMRACPSLGQWFSEQGKARDIIYGLFREFSPNVAVERNISFECHCNEDYYINFLRSLPKDQIQDIKENGPDPLEIICRNCGSVYKIPTSKI